VEARAADALLLDHGDREAGGRAVQGGGIPAWPPTENDDVEVIGHGPQLTDSTGEEDLDRRRGQDRHAGPGGQCDQHARAHEVMFARRFFPEGQPEGQEASLGGPLCSTVGLLTTR
jgi:hypothetical protein